MGSRIARRLVDTGHEVVVWNRTAAKAAPLVAAGGPGGAPPAAAAAGSEPVVTRVPAEHAPREVPGGPDGALGGAPPTTIAQMSPVGPEPLAHLQARLPAGV